MKTGTGSFWLAVAVAFTSMFDFEFVDVSQTNQGAQYHIVRYNHLTGEVTPCVADFKDDPPWGGCRLVIRGE